MISFLILEKMMKKWQHQMSFCTPPPSPTHSIRETSSFEGSSSERPKDQEK